MATAHRSPAGKVELTVYVPTELRKQLRLRAVYEDTTLSALVEQYIVRGLATRVRRRSS